MKININGVTRDMTAEEQAEMVQSSAQGPTQLDRVEAQAAYTAMMTDTLLEV